LDVAEKHSEGSANRHVEAGKVTETSSETVQPCPYCGDKTSHNHLYINTEKGVFQCWLCGVTGTTNKLFRDFPALKDRVDLSKLNVGKRQPPKLRLALQPLSVVPAGRFDAAKRYLLERGLTDEDVSKWKICGSLNYPHRVFFPDPTSGPTYFWTARGIYPNVRPKWLFPAKTATRVSAHKYVWALSSFSKGAVVWICEGIFDAIATSGVAIFGKVPSNIQLQKILSLEPKKIVVALDNDAHLAARQLQAKLRPLVPTQITSPPKGYKDYGEVMQRLGKRRHDEAGFPL
jgi:hypothetical protein